MAFFSVRTSPTFVVTVIPSGNIIAVFGGLDALAFEFQFSSAEAGVLISFCIVYHVFHRIRICLVGAFFADLVILRLDETFYAVFLKIQVILAAFITCVGNDTFKHPACMAFDPVKKRDQRVYVAPVGERTETYDVFVFHADLNIVLLN